MKQKDTSSAEKNKVIAYKSKKRINPHIKDLDTWLKEFMDEHDDVLRELAKR